MSSLLTLQLCFCRMPHIGQKRRNSIEATCDSSQCAFCSQRPQPDFHVQPSCTSDSHASTGAGLSNDFSSWLQAQKASHAVQEHIDLGKIGLPLRQALAGPPSKRNRTSIEICEASSSDSSDPSPATFGKAEESSSVLPMPANKSHEPGIPWAWSNEWADQPEPRPGTLAEVCSFSAPFSRGRSVQHTADIVCGVEFSPDGRFLATAGVAKQVFTFSLSCCIHVSCLLWRNSCTPSIHLLLATAPLHILASCTSIYIAVIYCLTAASTGQNQKSINRLQLVQILALQFAAGSAIFTGRAAAQP